MRNDSLVINSTNYVMMADAQPESSLSPFTTALSVFRADIFQSTTSRLGKARTPATPKAGSRFLGMSTATAPPHEL